MTLEEKKRLAVEHIVRSFANGGKLLLCGNGGSAADCAHITGELAKGFVKKRPLEQKLKDRIGESWANHLQQALPAIDLTANCALIAAIGNDLEGADVYAQQVLAYGQAGDVLIGISTSGNAENVIRAVRTAKALGLFTIGMTGEEGGRLKDCCDLTLSVPQRETYRVQEMHLQLYHGMCMDIEAAFFAE